MRMRRLEFGETDGEKFNMIYQGFLLGGNGPSSKGIDVFRREVKVLDKLDAISTEKEDGSRVLNEGPQSILLEQPEYDLLKKYFENTPWTTKVSRQVVNISDWLASIPVEETGG